MPPLLPPPPTPSNYMFLETQKLKHQKQCPTTVHMRVNMKHNFHIVLVVDASDSICEVLEVSVVDRLV